MKTMAFLVVLLTFFLFQTAHAIDESTQEIANPHWRSQDPCRIIEKEAWQASIEDPEIKKGIDHKSPAWTIYHASGPENKINPLVTMLAHQMGKMLNLIPAKFSDDPEGDLFYAMNYAVEEGGYTDYPGFGIQTIASTYQFMLARKRGENFFVAYQKYFGPISDKEIENARKVYVSYVLAISEITNRQYFKTVEDIKKSLDDVDVYNHFQGKEVRPWVIQALLQRIHSPLADVNLFKRKPLDEEFYGAIKCPE